MVDKGLVNITVADTLLNLPQQILVFCHVKIPHGRTGLPHPERADSHGEYNVLAPFECTRHKCASIGLRYQQKHRQHRANGPIHLRGYILITCVGHYTQWNLYKMKPLFTVVIYLTIPVRFVYVSSQIKCSDVTILRQKGVLIDNYERGDWRFFFVCMFRA